MTLFAFALVLAFLVLSGILWLAFGPPSARYGTLLPRTSEPASRVSDSSADSHTRPAYFIQPHFAVDRSTATRQVDAGVAYTAGSDGYAEHMRMRTDGAHLHLSGMMATGPQCAGSGRIVPAGRTASVGLTA